jgi:hypothetical protein
VPAVIHERLDLAHWVARFPLSGLDPEVGLSDPYSGPAIAAYAHQIRAAARAAGIDTGPAVPTDLCLWNWGDSDRRDVTKIGGVPYWPANKTWPHVKATGQPLTFVAQFCFADSTDILPTLPGDILSVFAIGDDYSTVWMTWHALGEQQTPPRKLPKPGWEIAPCYATLHRTADLPNARSEFDSPAERFFDRYKFPLNLEVGVFRRTAKIGGVWRSNGEVPEPQPDDDPEMRAELERGRENLKRMEREFIAQLITVGFSDPFPFLNVARVDDLSPSQLGFATGDLGGYSFFSDGSRAYENWEP